MPNPDAPITFIVSGEEQPIAAGLSRGAAAPLQTPFPGARIKHSIRVGTQRAGGTPARVTAQPGEDIVALHIPNGPTLFLHPANARDLMLAQQPLPKTARGRKSATAADTHEVEVPTRLQWRGLEEAAPGRGATRGFLGDLVLSGLEVITGIGKQGAASFAASGVVELVDGQVVSGVYRLQADDLPALKELQPLATVPASADGAPMLVFIHGTFSTTHRTFRKLWLEHPQRVRSLFRHYKDQVYALDHPTLGESPIENALTLVEALPIGARLHLVTHSRGGLVAEALARACGNASLPSRELDLFGGDEHLKQRKDLARLAHLVAQRGIKVERVVRVACPARGTLLASKRLDAYLSVLKWSLELAGLPVAPEIVDFLAEVAKRRADPEQIPGLAAQIPDSPLVQWLHAPGPEIAGDLRVVSGDIEGDSVMSWLKTLLADAFYWTDNDLIVQTRSMYGGTPRKAGATFLYDRGGKVTHFNYFSNPRTAEAITNALMLDEPAGFRSIGPLSWAGDSPTGVRGLESVPTGGDKPAVFVLPGILGSNLKLDDTRIWLSRHLVNNLLRLSYEPGQTNVQPDGPIEMIYEDLERFLSRSHEVIEFAYDWRKPVEEEARRLGAKVEQALEARELTNQPVRIIAHSMGGLVVRTMQLECPGVWDRMMLHKDARLVMLGTPNGGSWAPMQVLSGDDTFGNILVSAGALFQDHKARVMMASLPGFIQLQAGLLDNDGELATQKKWAELADEDLRRVRDHNFWHSDDRQLIPYKWGVPPQDVLDLAVSLRERLDRQRAEVIGKYARNIVMVVGKSEFTPDGYDVAGDGLYYLNAADAGDGRVTLSSALLPGVRTWQLDCEHGTLPSRETAFLAYLELLETGTTELLGAVATPTTRSGAVVEPVRAPSRPSRQPTDDRPPEAPRDVLRPPGAAPARSDKAAGGALRVTVVNGDLMFERLPLMLGHYRSLRLTGTEHVMDGLIGGAMSSMASIGQYPDLPGSHRVFSNTRGNPDDALKLPRPEAVVVVGLGPEGEMRSSHLERSVFAGVLASAQRVKEKGPGAPAVFDLAATMIGSGGIGFSVAQSAQAIVRGVYEANRRLVELEWPSVGHLHLIDLYLDRASEAWRALKVEAAANAGLCDVTDVVVMRPGALERPLDSGYRGAAYDYISAVTERGEEGREAISYTLDTRRARSEVRAQATQLPLVRELMTAVVRDYGHDNQTGRTLFQLLVPVELRSFLTGTTELQLELDEGTAGIPWELLESGGNEADNRQALPWSIRAKLLRKLRTDEFRSEVTEAQADASVLIIGEPACPPRYPPLPGARAEAQAVAKRFREVKLDSDRLRAVISSDDPGQPGPDATVVTNALFARPWRIVHIAGHGELPAEDGTDPRGIVLSNETFFGWREIRAMEAVPELVFVNCCHLGAFDSNQLLKRSAEERTRFAVGVAEQLIAIGVRCVVAAAWPVADDAAKTFADTFYKAILTGRRFIDAIAEAREAAWELGGNTWAVYQCYGDPDWMFQRGTSDAQRPSAPLTDEFANVASPSSLALALETLAVRSKFQKAPRNEQHARIRYLEERFRNIWGHVGKVAEAFGAAWDASGNVPEAIGWYEKAVAAPDASASMKALEQLANVRVRAAFERVPLDLSPKNAAKARAARKEIVENIRLLETFASVQRSMERENLLGSAHKRLAMIAGRERDAKAETEAVTQMQKHYAEAEALGLEQALPDTFYPVQQRIAADLFLNAGKKDWGGFADEDLLRLRKALTARAHDDPDFWSIVGLVELRIAEAIAARNLAHVVKEIAADLDDRHNRVAAPRMWASVYDNTEFVSRSTRSESRIPRRRQR